MAVGGTAAGLGGLVAFFLGLIAFHDRWSLVGAVVYFVVPPVPVFGPFILWISGGGLPVPYFYWWLAAAVGAAFAAVGAALMPDDSQSTAVSPVAMSASSAAASVGPLALDVPGGAVGPASTAVPTGTVRSRPVWLAALLAVLSGPFYMPFWFGVTWAELRKERGDARMSAPGHALATLIPIYSAFRVHAHFRVIREHLAPANLPTLHPLVAVFIFLLAYFGSSQLDMSRLLRVNALLGSSAGLLLQGLIGSVLVIAGQVSLNAYWGSGRSRLPVRTGIRNYEWVVLFALVGFWWFVLLYAGVLPMPAD